MLALASGVAKRFKVGVATTGEGRLADLFEPTGLEVSILTASELINTFGGGIRKYSKFRLIRTALEVAAYNLRFKSLLRKSGTSYVVANDLRSLLLCAGGCRLARVPLIWHVRDDSRLGAFHSLGGRLADRIVTVSDGVRAVFHAADNHAFGWKLRTVYTGLASLGSLELKEAARHALNIPPGYLAVTTVGMLTPRKGQLDFVEVAKMLSQSVNKPLQFLIVGNSPAGYEEYAASLADAVSSTELKPGDEFRLLGWRPDVARILRASDLLLHPSVGEGLPRVLLESLQQETPVVTNNVSGASEIIRTGQDGYISDIGDLETMVCYAEILLNSDVMRGEMGKSGQDNVETKFSMEGYIDAFCLVLGEL